MSQPKMLFHRDFRGYTGGHGKVWDYFNHALALGWDARVHLTADSLRDAGNPWMAVPGRIEPEWHPESADVLFLAGMDWMAWEPPAGTVKPTVALVQHVRHADPGLPLYGFLERPATRICVSRAVAEAIVGTGRVRGPVRTIPAGLELPSGIERAEGGGQGVFIGALKDPVLGVALAALLRARGHEVVLSEGWLPRNDYLAHLARAAVAVPLPHPTEGFFLPGLEAMALGCPLVMPDCRGNGEYAVDGGNCLMPAAEPLALAEAVDRLLADPVLAARLAAGGRQTAKKHSLAAERQAFDAVLKELWP